MQRYSKEIIKFIVDNVNGRTTPELVKLVNEKFNAGFTESKMKSFKSNYKLKSGTQKGNAAGSSVIFSTEIQEFINDHVKGVTSKHLTDLINSTFNTNYSVSQIVSYKKNHKKSSGVDSKFKPGLVPHNKGKKGQCAKGCEATWFRKGSIPHNHKPIGSERIDSKDGYTLVKTAEPNVWELKHKVLYESVHGKVPDGYVVTFLDGDKTKITLDNLQLISMAESLILTNSKLRFRDADLTKTGILIVKIKRAKANKIRMER